jgi:hypothetical protein
VWGHERAGDDDLILHYEVTRLHAAALHGPDPATVFGAIGRSIVAGRLAAEATQAPASTEFA